MKERVGREVVMKASQLITRGLVLLLLFVSVACDGSDSASGTGEASIQDSTQTVDTTLKLYVFECGRLRFDTVENFSIGNDETDVRDLVVPCYIIDHPAGRMIWDGGLPSYVADTEGWHDNERIGRTAQLDRTLAEQLSELELGFDLNSFDYMAFSHIHYDHVGVANEVRGARWLVQRGDFDAAFAEPATVPALQPELLANLRDGDYLILDGDHDVFGDGRVQLISAPGHTPGHQVLFLDLVETGPLVLSGDLYHFRLSREDRRVPVFNVDPMLSLASMDRVETLVAERNATMWIEHDLALFETLRTAPEFYE